MIFTYASRRISIYFSGEHQDTNNAQNKIIEFLADFYERPNLLLSAMKNKRYFVFREL